MFSLERLLEEGALTRLTLRLWSHRESLHILISDGGLRSGGEDSLVLDTIEVGGHRMGRVDAFFLTLELSINKLWVRTATEPCTVTYSCMNSGTRKPLPLFLKA